MYCGCVMVYKLSIIIFNTYIMYDKTVIIHITCMIYDILKLTSNSNLDRFDPDDCAILPLGDQY